MAHTRPLPASFTPHTPLRTCHFCFESVQRPLRVEGICPALIYTLRQLVLHWPSAVRLVHSDRPPGSSHYSSPWCLFFLPLFSQTYLLFFLLSGALFYFIPCFYCDSFIIRRLMKLNNLFLLFYRERFEIQPAFRFSSLYQDLKHNFTEKLVYYSVTFNSHNLRWLVRVKAPTLLLQPSCPFTLEFLWLAKQ